MGIKNNGRSSGSSHFDRRTGQRYHRSQSVDRITKVVRAGNAQGVKRHLVRAAGRIGLHVAIRQHLAHPIGACRCSRDHVGARLVRERRRIIFACDGAVDPLRFVECAVVVQVDVDRNSRNSRFVDAVETLDRIPQGVA